MDRHTLVALHYKCPGTKNIVVLGTDRAELGTELYLKYYKGAAEAFNGMLSSQGVIGVA